MSKLIEKQFQFTADIAHLILFIDSIGFNVKFGEVLRTGYQQAEYVRQGLSKTQNSRHLNGLAADLWIFDDTILIKDKDRLQPIGDYWTNLSQGNKWGGNWKFTDISHFETNL